MPSSNLRLLALAALLIVSSLLLVGCGGSSGGGDAPERTEVTVQKDIVYAQRNTGPLLADVYLPVEPNGGAVVLVHGGGWIRGVKEDFSGQAAAFAQSGYVAFTPSYRLVKDESTQYPAAVDDVQEFVRWARSQSEQFEFDPVRVAAFGHSAGGHLVSMLGTTETRDTSLPLADRFPSRVGCVISLSAPYDLTVAGDEDLQTLFDTFVKPELRADASPITHVDSASAHFLMLHGTRDALIPFEQATAFDAALRNSGAESHLVPLEGETHNYRYDSTRVTIQTESEKFLADCLNL